MKQSFLKKIVLRSISCFKERGYSTVDGMASPLAISIVSPMSPYTDFVEKKVWFFIWQNLSEIITPSVQNYYNQFMFIRKISNDYQIHLRRYSFFIKQKGLKPKKFHLRRYLAFISGSFISKYLAALAACLPLESFEKNIKKSQ